MLRVVQDLPTNIPHDPADPNLDISGHLPNHTNDRQSALPVTCIETRMLNTVSGSSPSSMMFAVNHSFLDITALIPSPNWLIGLNSLDLCKNEKRVTFTSRNWATEPRGVVTVITNTDNLCPLKEQPHHHQQPLPHPNGYDEHEDSLQFNIVSHDYHDQRMDTDGAGVIGDSLRVSGLDPPDDDDASRVDGLNSDALKQITNKGVHHNNKMDEPKNENSTEHSDEHNHTAETCLPTWTHPTKPTSYQHRHFLNEQQDKR